MNSPQLRQFATIFGLLIVFGYFVYTSLSYAAHLQQDSAARELRAMQMAKSSRSLETWLSKDHGYTWSANDDNESVIRRAFWRQRELFAEIVGWKSQNVRGDTYLISCKYERDGQERGYYFEVNLNVETVIEIFADTALATKYEEFDVHPEWKIVETRDPEFPGASRLDLRVAD